MAFLRSRKYLQLLSGSSDSGGEGGEPTKQQAPDGS